MIPHRPHQRNRARRTRHPTRRVRRSAPAFSLLELAIVLAVATVTLSIAAPRYNNSLAQYRAETSARFLAACLRASIDQCYNASTTIVFSFEEGQPVVTIALDDPTFPEPEDEADDDADEDADEENVTLEPEQETVDDEPLLTNPIVLLMNLPGNERYMQRDGNTLRVELPHKAVIENISGATDVRINGFGMLSDSVEIQLAVGHHRRRIGIVAETGIVEVRR